MARIFGHAWTARYGETDDGMWAAVIGPLSRDQVKGGLRVMLNDWTDSFPPTPAQFRHQARDSIRGMPAPPEKRIEVKPADPEKQAKHMQALREMVGLAPKQEPSE